MKKIVHICMAQYSDGWTYQENLLAKYHKKAGYDVTVLTSMLCFKEGKLVEDDKEEFVDINGVKVIRLPKKSKGILGKVPSYEGFFEALEDISPDIIFSHGCQYKDTVNVIKYIKKNKNVELYVDNHGDFTNSARSFISLHVLHKIIWKYYAKKLVKYTNVFWGVLPARVDFLTDVYGLPKDKCKLLVMGADDEFVEKSANEEAIGKLREKYGVKNDDFLIVTGGKIDKAKIQTKYLIEAVSKISRDKIKLLVFGSIEKEIEEEVMEYVDGVRTIYAGWIKPEQSYDYFAAADLVVFPGRHSVFWEQAAGQGKPMICKSWDGTRHVDVGGNVLFLEDTGTDSIKKALEDLVDDTAGFEKMKKVAEDKGVKTFSYQKIAEKAIKKPY